MTAPPSRPEASPRPGLTPMERQLLEILDRGGPVPASRLPVRWPLTRMHLPIVLERLAAAGLIRVESSRGSRPWVVLTRAGKASARVRVASACSSERGDAPGLRCGGGASDGLYGNRINRELRCRSNARPP